jgi:hypothetical protein
MTRSYRKNPIFGHTCATSERFDKKTTNKKFRFLNKRLLKLAYLNENDILFYTKLRQISDVWGFIKDGKYYDRSYTLKDLRK